MRICRRNQASGRRVRKLGRSGFPGRFKLVACGLRPQTCGAWSRTRCTIGAETCPTTGEGWPSCVATDALGRADSSSSGGEPARASTGLSEGRGGGRRCDGDDRTTDPRYRLPDSSKIPLQIDYARIYEPYAPRVLLGCRVGVGLAAHRFDEVRVGSTSRIESPVLRQKTCAVLALPVPVCRLYWYCLRPHG